MNPISEVLLIAGRELRNNLRSVRALGLAALTLLGGLAAALIGGKVFMLTERARELGSPEVVREGMIEGISHLYSGDSLVAMRLVDAPPTLIVLGWLSVWLCPLLVALIGFDAVSAERQHRTVRFFVVRTRRSSYYLGKWAGVWLTCSLVMFGTQLPAWVREIAIDKQPPLDVLGWGLLMYSTTIPILAAWTAVAHFVGSLIKTPMLSLLVIVGSFASLWVLGHLPMVSDSMPEALLYLYPSSFDHFLLRSEPLDVLRGVAACAAYPLLLVGGGALLFERLDT